MLSVQIYPIISRAEPLMWDVYSYINGRLVVIEKLSTAVAQRRLDQARVERARLADMQISREMAVV